MTRYKPIRINDSRFGYGYWWGKYCFFFGKCSTCFAIVPVWYIINYSVYTSNYNVIKHGNDKSWSLERQKEYKED